MCPFLDHSEEGERFLSALSGIYDSQDAPSSEALVEDYALLLMRRDYDASDAPNMEHLLNFSKAKGFHDLGDNASLCEDSSRERFTGVLGLYSYFFDIMTDALFEPLSIYEPPPGWNWRGGQI
jgi:hypothetical protein